MPNGIHKSPEDSDPLYSFYKIHECDLTEEEIKKYLFYKQLHYLKSIEKTMTMIRTLLILSAIGVFVLLIYNIYINFVWYYIFLMWG